MYGLKKIKVVDVNHLHKACVWSKENNSINFFGEISDNFMVKMKIVGKEIRTVFVNGNEQFSLTMHENGETSQRLLSQIGSKKVQHIYLDKYSDTGACYLVACNEYDEGLHLYRAFTPEFHVMIP